MTIDKSHSHWKGTEAADLDEYLVHAASENYPADRIVHARCKCSGKTFRVEVDDNAGCARRTCTKCHTQHLMLDSADFWAEADPGPCECLCGTDKFEVAVAFSHRGDGALRWVTIGMRCIACGALGVYADWKVDYEPTEHLYGAV
jgi:hypothetical protein